MADPLTSAPPDPGIGTWADWLADASPLIMGILNVTPDSFSDGGDFFDVDAALARAARIWEDGAHLIDIGGESTRPGAAPVDVSVELERVMPVITACAAGDRPVSVDTRNAAVMRAAIDALHGTAAPCVINDVSALTHDPDSLPVVADSDALIVLMHMKGEPASMNDDPHYDDVVAEVRDYLEERAAAAMAAGVGKGRIAVDPGLGFGKNHQHNLALLHNLETIVGLGFPVMVGASRKLASWSAAETVRLTASTTAAVVAAQRGAAIVRVHDVAETRVSLRIAGFDV